LVAFTRNGPIVVAACKRLNYYLHNWCHAANQFVECLSVLLYWRLRRVCNQHCGWTRKANIVGNAFW